MSRGRHVKRSGLLIRLRRIRRYRPVHARLHRFEGELSRLRVLGIAHAAAAASADERARRAQEQLEAVRAELAALREELVWAFAESRLPAPAPAAGSVPTAGSAPTPGSAPGVVVDLRAGAVRTA